MPLSGCPACGWGTEKKFIVPCPSVKAMNACTFCPVRPLQVVLAQPCRQWFYQIGLVRASGFRYQLREVVWFSCQQTTHPGMYRFRQALSGYRVTPGAVVRQSGHADEPATILPHRVPQQWGLRRSSPCVRRMGQAQGRGARLPVRDIIGRALDFSDAEHYQRFSTLTNIGAVTST
jgi:hypothetical protein